MSIFTDFTDDILGGDDNLNENINEGDIPSEGEDGDGEKDENGERVEIKVEPKKRSVLNPRPRLTVELLKGERGIHTLENYFKGIKFGGKGHEKKDLNIIIRKMQHWAHRLYPNYNFDDILSNIDRLGKKKPLQMYMNQYRQDLLEINKPIDELVDDENNAEVAEPFDEFDALLGEQIAISKLIPPKTPNRSNMSTTSSIINTPKFMQDVAGTSSTPYFLQNHRYTTPTPSENMYEMEDMRPIEPIPKKLNTEQMARIAENRRLAQERLRAKREGHS